MANGTFEAAEELSCLTSSFTIIQCDKVRCHSLKQTNATISARPILMQTRTAQKLLRLRRRAHSPALYLEGLVLFSSHVQKVLS
jgi:hypothetical protein